MLGAATAPARDEDDSDDDSSSSDDESSSETVAPLPAPAPAPVTGQAESGTSAGLAVRLLSTRVRRDGTLRVALRWPAGFRGRLQVRLTLAGSPRVVLGTRTITVRSGRSLSLRVRLTARGKRVLARPGSQRVRVSVRRLG